MPGDAGSSKSTTSPSIRSRKKPCALNLSSKFLVDCPLVALIGDKINILLPKPNDKILSIISETVNASRGSWCSGQYCFPVLEYRSLK